MGVLMSTYLCPARNLGFNEQNTREEQSNVGGDGRGGERGKASTAFLHPLVSLSPDLESQGPACRQQGWDGAPQMTGGGGGREFPLST